MSLPNIGFNKDSLFLNTILYTSIICVNAVTIAMIIPPIYTNSKYVYPSINNCDIPIVDK